MNSIRCLILAIVTAEAYSAGAQVPREFEVASIKADRSGGDGTTINNLPGGRFVASNATLKALVQFAFGIQDFQVAGGPGWLDSDPYDISATAGGGEHISDLDSRRMLQVLLADRFQLKFHRDTKDISVYSLTVAKSGSKLVQHTGPNGPSGGTYMGAGKAKMTATKVGTAMLAEGIARATGRPVIDNTGLAGKFDFNPEWVPDQSADSTGPSIFTALQEQLGLRLESAKRPVEILVIDSAEKASEN